MQIKTKIVSSHTADSKSVKQEVNSTVILSPLVFPGLAHLRGTANCQAEKNIFIILKRYSSRITTKCLTALFNLISFKFTIKLKPSQIMLESFNYFCKKIPIGVNCF
jgi:hypothetical protein